jgi:hypothetical protein
MSCTIEMAKFDTCAELSVWGLMMLRAMHHTIRRSDTMGMLHHCQVNSCWIDNKLCWVHWSKCQQSALVAAMQKYVHWTVMLAQFASEQVLTLR